MRAFGVWCHRVFERFVLPVRTSRWVMPLLGVVLLVGIFGLGHDAAAIDFPSLADAEKWFVGLIGSALNIIIATLGSLVLIMVNILIAFASYNNFVNAQPVQLGWVLMRDVVNMFFIVVLLVSAFSTIIGYKHLHYKEVLPKLLLMAVLINFSKTLIGLMIDFSQVLMLTFVNAFRQAAGGNFVSALKLDKIIKLDVSQPDANEPWKLLGAAILGVMMLGISLTLLIIMVAFLVFRIVGLWLLLIMSPMAFFAWALPSKLQKGFTAFTDNFWSRLSTLLIAGPVMAFFLWLTLAIVQQGGAFKETLGNEAEVRSATEKAGFASAVGNASDIATFIVAVALLLQGVEFAVKSSQQVSESLGRFAKAASSGGGVAVHLARASARIGGRAAGLAARGTAATAKGGFNALDRFTDVRGKIGRAGLAASASLGGVGAETFAGMTGYRGRQVAERRARVEKGAAGLSAEDRLAYYAAKTGSFDQRTADAAKISLAQTSSSRLGLKALTKEEEGKLSHIQDEGERKTMAEALAQRRAAAFIKDGSTSAKDVGDDASLEKLQDAVQKNPALAASYADLAGETVMKESVPEYFRKFSMQAWNDSATVESILHSSGAAINGEWQTDSAAYKYLEKNGGKRFELAKQHMTQDPAERKKLRDALQAKGSDEEKAQLGKVADQARWHMGKDSSGRAVTMKLSQAAPQIKVEQKLVRNEQKNEQKIEQFRQLAESADREGNDLNARGARMNMVGEGATLKEAFNFNPSQGVFENRKMAEGFSRSSAGLSEGLSKRDQRAMEILSRFDVDSLAANPGGYNEARAAAIANIDLDSLQSAYQEAMEKGNTAVQKKVSQLVDTFEKEASRLEKIAKGAGLSSEDIVELEVNPTSAAAQGVKSKLSSAGVASPVEAAQAISKGWDIRNKHSDLRSGVASRGATQARRKAQEVGAAATGKVASFREERARAKERGVQDRENKREQKRQKFEDDSLGKG